MIKLESSIVSVDWLNTNINSPDLIILDSSIEQVTNATDNVSEIQIPNTIFFDIKTKFSDVNSAFPNTVPSSELFSIEARKLGINHDSTIVVYDDKGIYSSARVWWLFKAFGFDNIAVLDGGLPQWIASHYKTEIKQIRPIKEGNFNANYNPEYFKFFKDVIQLQNNTNCLILDARSSSRFNGEIEEPRPGLRSGNIPNSKSLPYTELFNGFCLKPKNELELIFKRLLNGEDNLVFTCGSGITACILALVAEIIGLNNLSVYDGSWTEYGSLTT